MKFDGKQKNKFCYGMLYDMFDLFDHFISYFTLFYNVLPLTLRCCALFQGRLSQAIGVETMSMWLFAVHQAVFQRYNGTFH